MKQAQPGTHQTKSYGAVTSSYLARRTHLEEGQRNELVLTTSWILY